MIRTRVIASLQELAILLGPTADETEWHLFGSVGRDEVEALDIDLMILCKNDAQADLLRQAIDLDSFMLPLHLSLLTFEEAAAINAPNMQQAIMIHPLASGSDHISSFTH